MPSFKDIFSDGPEHFVRFINRAAIRQKLLFERERLKKRLRTLGGLAWNHLPSISIELKSGKEIKKYKDKQKQIQKDSSKHFSELQKQLDQEQTQRREELHRSSELMAKLSQTGKKLKKSIVNIKVARKTLRSEKGNLSKLESRISELEKQREEAVDTEQQSEKPVDPAEIKKRIEELSKEAESARKEVAAAERKLNNLKKSKNTLEEQIKEADLQVRQKGEIRKEFREKISGFESEQKKLLAEVKKLSQPLQKKIQGAYLGLGKEISNNRHAHQELDAIYAQIDLSKTTIEMLEGDDKAESVLLNLLDDDSIKLFYIISGGTLIVAIFLMILITFSIVNVFI